MRQQLITLLVLVLYRIITVLIVFFPLFINLFLQTKLIVSLLYIPLLSLLLAILAFMFDRKLQHCLHQLFFQRSSKSDIATNKMGSLDCNYYELKE